MTGADFAHCGNLDDHSNLETIDAHVKMDGQVKKEPVQNKLDLSVNKERVTSVSVLLSNQIQVQVDRANQKTRLRINVKANRVLKIMFRKNIKMNHGKSGNLLVHLLQVRLTSFIRASQNVPHRVDVRTNLFVRGPLIPANQSKKECPQSSQNPSNQYAS